MPLHFIGECCKCESKIYKDLWAIKKNHGYSGKIRVCTHFDIDIDHESETGFLGWKWKNTIKVTAYYKPNYESKVIINRTFDKDNMEYQDYGIFSNKVVFHARISDSKNNDPTIGSRYQKEIEYNERREQQRREAQQKQLQRECDLQLSRLLEKEEEEEEERKNDLKLLEEKCIANKKTTFKRHNKLINLDIDGIFDLERRRLISK